jgi:endonuclease-8
VPEGHTLRIAANRLQPLVGHEVAVEAPQPRHRHAGFDALDGQRLEEVRAIGKHLLLRFEDGRTVHSHLRMRGSWQVYRDGQPWRRPPSAAWLVLRAGGRTAVLLRGPVLELLEPGRLKLHPVLSRLGPDVLADELDPDGLVARIRRGVDPQVQVGDLLLDQRVACGIGNVYKSEALWARRVDPFAPIGRLDDALLASLYAEARQRMLAAVADEREGPHRIYRQPRCPRCGGPVASRAQGDEGRTTYWCESCVVFPSDRLP